MRILRQIFKHRSWQKKHSIETIYAFGGLCLIDSIEEIAYLNDICDRLGMDTITAGNLCAFTIEAARRGKIDFKIDYGEVDAIANLLKMSSRLCLKNTTGCMGGMRRGDRIPDDRRLNQTVLNLLATDALRYNPINFWLKVHGSKVTTVSNYLPY